MKPFLLAFLFITSFCSAQNILAYEKEISNKDDYNWEEINFKVPDKKESIELSGTLLSPKTDWKTAVIIIPGSGADTRNSHYRLTEELLKNNIAVYRYDERGMGKSGGKFNPVNYTISKMSEELGICIQTLRQDKSLSGKQIGLLGHSQGGMVTIQAYENQLPIDFLVQWATPIQKHGEFIKYQITTGQNTFKDDIAFDVISKKLEIVTALHKVVEENLNDDNVALGKKLDKVSKQIGYTKEHYTRFPYLTFVNEKDIVRKNFEPVYKSMKIPVLYIIGSKDTFVNPESESQLLSSFDNKNITIIKLDGLSHYLTQLPLTLNTIYDIDKTASAEIVNWIKIR